MRWSQHFFTKSDFNLLSKRWVCPIFARRKSHYRFFFFSQRRISRLISRHKSFEQTSDIFFFPQHLRDVKREKSESHRTSADLQYSYNSFLLRFTSEPICILEIKTSDSLRRCAPVTPGLSLEAWKEIFLGVEKKKKKKVNVLWKNINGGNWRVHSRFSKPETGKISRLISPVPRAYQTLNYPS